MWEVAFAIEIEDEGAADLPDLIHWEGGTVMSQGFFRRMCGVAVLFALMAAPLMAVAAESVELEGLIKARNGDRIVLQTKVGSDLTVLLTDSTNVGQVQGMFKARHKDMSMAALIPGLAIKVKGSYNDDHELVAETIRFKGNDLNRALSMQAGMHETKEQTELNRQNIESNKAQLEEHQAELARQNAAIQEAVARFGQLDDYYIFDEVVILFANGKAALEPQYIPQLIALAEKAKGIEGYMIEVKGYASAVGSAKANQALSADRADNVTQVLIQQCKIPLTRMLAPGAMGESEQIGQAETKEGEAHNRRVVVRVLQNKAIAGKLAE